MKRECQYCGELKDKDELGYVKAYDAWVCEECYDDHHGPIF